MNGITKKRVTALDELKKIQVEMKQNKKTKIKGCACYGVNSIHPCFCSPFSNKEVKIKTQKLTHKNKV